MNKEEILYAVRSSLEDTIETLNDLKDVLESGDVSQAIAVVVSLSEILDLELYEVMEEIDELDREIPNEDENE